jgi:hypothetical protein
MVLFSFCSEPTMVDFSEIPAYQERIVVNAAFSDGEDLRFLVTNSENAYSDDGFETFTNGVVRFFKNGVEVGVAQDQFDGFYEAGTNLNSGDVIDIQVESPQYPNVTSTFVVPEVPVFTATLLPGQGIDETGVASDLIRVSIDDNFDVKNFYKLTFFYFDEFANSYELMSYISTDAILSSNTTPVLNDGGVLFSDEGFNGRIRNFEVVPPFGLVIDNTDIKYRVKVETVSEDLYKYLVSLNNYEGQQDADGPFANAVVIHSNVEGGLGVTGTTKAINRDLK